MITVSDAFLSEKPRLSVDESYEVVESVGSIWVCVEVSVPSVLPISAMYCIDNGTAEYGTGKP